MTINVIVVHNSVFHADDVFSVAMARLMNPDIMVVRTSNPEMLKGYVPAVEKGTALMVDVGAAIGQTKFDHHQVDARRRSIEDGIYHNHETNEDETIKYCGFGLLWEAYGHKLCPTEKAFHRVERELVIPIDRCDNGQGENTLSATIKAFNPTWKEGRAEEDNCFWQAEAFAEMILQRYVDSANAAVEAEEYILASRKLDDGQILVLEEHRPWEVFVAEEMPHVKWCIYPSSRNHGRFNLQKAPVAPESKEGRCKFPKAWLGNPPVEMGMTFCHIGNWLAEVDTLEHAINIARYCIDVQKKDDAAEFLLSGYRRGNVLTTAANIHLLVYNEEYAYIWADGDSKKTYLGSYEDAPGTVIINEGDVHRFVDERYVG